MLGGVNIRLLKSEGETLRRAVEETIENGLIHFNGYNVNYNVNNVNGYKYIGLISPAGCWGPRYNEL
jgi:hypothetical protein